MMPELPEVETVRRTLNELIPGKIVRSVEIRWPKIIRRPNDPAEFARQLEGETLDHVDRRGKFLLFRFRHKVMLSHLRMEGRYRLESEDAAVDKYTHILFHFTDDTVLHYRDVRKFGTMHLFNAGEEEDQLPLSKLGPEPLSPDFSARSLEKSCLHTSRAIKPLLLDQTAVVGLGNIYVDEALFRAGVHPLSPASSLSGEQFGNLYQAIVSTLSEAVALGGSSVRTFVNSQGHMGFFQQKLKVYGRKDEPCMICGTPIEKIKVGGRGTHFCPHCQKRGTGICLESV